MRVLGFILLLMSVLARAGSVDDFSFISQPYFNNTYCGGAIQNATYILKNNEHVSIKITHITLTREDVFSPNLITVDNGSLTTCKVNTAVPGQGTCAINLIVHPNAGCTSYLISEDVQRYLTVGINTWEQEVRADAIVFNYQTLMPPEPPTPEASFAVLGRSVQNLGSVSSIIGNIGHTGGGITDNFYVTQGQLYTNSNDPEVLAANAQFTQTYETFIDNQAGCRPRTNIDDGDKIQSSYYCLSTDNSASYVSVDGEITLSGPGQFVFFIETPQPSCFTGAPTGSCNLWIGSHTQFLYEDGASNKNVYWIVAPNQTVTISPGAAFDGTVLAGGDITTGAAGTSAATIHGQLWAQGSITLYGDTVADQQIDRFK